MKEFWVMENLNGPGGWLTAQAISVARDEIAKNPIQLRWMINPCVLGMPKGPFTIAVKEVPKPSDLRKKTDIANDPDGWKKIEVVGLPLDGRMGCNYDSSNQGPVFDAGTPQEHCDLLPSEAAFRRLELGAPLRGWPPLPGALPNPISDIEWRTPAPEDYVEDLLRSPLIDGICRLLNQGLPPAGEFAFDVELGAADAPHLSVDVTNENPEFAEMAGHNKAGKWRPLGIMLLAAATDPLAALALGFGTAVPFDFSGMAFRISAPFDLPDLSSVQVADVVWVEDASLRPGPVKNLIANLISFNPPKFVNHAGTDSVGVQWERPQLPAYTQNGVVNPSPTDVEPYPVSYAIAKFDEGGANPRILLTQRREINGWLPYVATKTGDNRPIVFNDHLLRGNIEQNPDPFEHVSTYLVAAQDIFGRWSDWEIANYKTEREPAQIPAVLGVKLKLREERNAELPPDATPLAHDELTVDFSWDWTTRSPQFIELSGAYADDPTREVFNSFLKFEGDFKPRPVDNNVIPLDQDLQKADDWGDPQDVHPDPLHPGEEIREQSIRYYRLTMELDIEFANREERAFHVKARGQCALHERAQPGFNISPFGPPVSTILKNPGPPDAPELSILEPLEAPLWATLPDSAGASRIVLRWAPVPRAKGYFLYEATESSLLNGTDTSLPYTQRLANLRNHNQPLHGKKLQFQRVNQEPIQEKNGAVSHEVTLPRGSRVIHLYAVTAKTENQIESDFPESNENYFAVAAPRLGVPSPPTLEVTPVPDAVPPRVELKPRAGPGIETSHFEIYRTRREDLAKRLDKIGPPLLFNGATGEESLHDEIAPGWGRVWYRAVAWSADDPLQGIVAARSLPSPAVSVLLPPAGPPSIFDVRVNEDGSTETEALVSWKSDAPLTLSPLGYHTAAVEARSLTGQFLYSRQQRLDTMQKVASTVGLPPAPDGAILCIDEGNSYRLLARLPRSATLLAFRLTVKMIDPLGRIGSAHKDVPHLKLAVPPQLSPITFERVPPTEEGFEGETNAVWEILSPILETALNRYTFSVRLELKFVDGKDRSIQTETQTFNSTLEDIFGGMASGIMHVPGTTKFLVGIDFRLSKIEVRLTDPLDRSTLQFVEIGFDEPRLPTEPGRVEVPDVRGLSLEAAIRELARHGLAAEVAPADPDDILTEVVAFTDPVQGESVPLGTLVQIFLSKRLV